VGGGLAILLGLFLLLIAATLLSSG